MSGDSLAEAVARVEADHPRAAAELLARHLAAHPGDASALRLLAAVQARLGERFRALETIRASLRVDADDAWSWTLVAELTTALGEHEEARAASRTARRLRPDAWWTHASVIWTDLATGLVSDETREAAIDCLRLGGDVPDAYLAPAGLALADDRLRAAGTAYRAALHLDPEHEGALRGLARLDLLEGRVTKATTATLAMLATRPTSRPALLQLRGILHGALARTGSVLLAAPFVYVLLTFVAFAIADTTGDSPALAVAVGAAAVLTFVGTVWLFVRAVLRFARHLGDHLEPFLANLWHLSPAHAIWFGLQLTTLLGLAVLAVAVAAIDFDDPVLGRIALTVVALLVVSFLMRPALTLSLSDSPNRAARESG